MSGRKKLTFLGTRLKRCKESYTQSGHRVVRKKGGWSKVQHFKRTKTRTYYGTALVELDCSRTGVSRPWCARPRGVLLDCGMGWTDGLGETEEKALRNLEKAALKLFTKLGNALGYEVE